jgi:hypothetical protein
MMGFEMYRWQCPICKKILVSMYRSQLEANAVNHLMTHRVKVIKTEAVSKNITEGSE